ncbi:valine--tRNA ligase [Candidatus Shapirobacteria bacterium CG10_big_fil_rev_8_21_14_0_10_36_6]|uniref:Valine--tRNA ligase n=1 Tax=Candidatus Shapirobacteria bacterium CG10_big_fil_rev_8_21_14_0_10_36_6 TaxID=1974886 RepID=A0A2M8L1Y6_9BACT|nr:MAG: valine--tRNA ligase [Candidatus Shapirobacteria bacterium CG10_big_fil_rev_8_21_14_0_10_36_6]
MEKNYSSTDEDKTYKLWEESGAFIPRIDKTKKPYSIILPLPNANDPMHMGHALFTIEDILVRYHRMLGDPTLWLPGGDHAGIETQFVFEKNLKKENKSRFDFDRETLYQKIWDFVEKNRILNMYQMKKLGFSMDWSRYHYSLEPAIIKNVSTVFKKLYNDGLVYRDEKIVNYCTFCGTAFSNLEVDHKNVDSHLWYIKYGLLTVATTRPETMLGDTAVAVNPKDKRYAKLIGTKIMLPLVNREIPVIGEETIDIKFGTGAVKVTPSHSPEDYDMAKKHGLEFMRIFDYDGKTNNNVPEKYRGLFPSQVREVVINDLTELGLMEKIENYSHEVGHCYRCGRVIEPITAPQWYVKIDKLAKPAIEAAKKGEVKFFPTRFKKSFIDWMENIRDWNISRQIVWGPRIPAWYCLDCNPNIKINFLDKNKNIISGFYKDLKNKYDFKEIKNGLQSLVAPVSSDFQIADLRCQKCKGEHTLQETDTFDTWFLSGQWPLNTLGFNPENLEKSSEDFKYFYPTSVLDTLWDILFFWVARMMMFGLYLTGDVPFKTVHLHARCTDSKGQKMSKSKGNVVDPLIMSEKYGTDALRMSLVYGIAPASDFVISEDKIRAQRNFVNKIWNATRFILMKIGDLNPSPTLPLTGQGDQDNVNILDKLKKIVKSTTDNLNKYRFGQASEDLYQFFWHDFCDVYIESTKNKGPEVIPVLIEVLVTSLKLLHPFMPFVTETIYQETKEVFKQKEKMLITSTWPK